MHSEEVKGNPGLTANAEVLEQMSLRGKKQKNPQNKTLIIVREV